MFTYISRRTVKISRFHNVVLLKCSYLRTARCIMTPSHYVSLVTSLLSSEYVMLILEFTLCILGSFLLHCVTHVYIV